jgi:hypothetical protein
MKNISAIILLLLFTNNIYSQVVVGAGTAHPSAQLDIKSTNRGLLPPRMKQFERDDIVSPPAGLLIWCTDCGNGKIPDAVSFTNYATRNIETAGQMQVFNGKTWTDIHGGATLEAEPIVSFQQATFPSGSAKILQSCNFLVTLKYSGGNGVQYIANRDAFYSTDATGMVAVLENTSGIISRNSGEIVFRVTGLPMKYGDANFEVKFFNNVFTFKVPISSGNLSNGKEVPFEQSVFDPKKDDFKSLSVFKAQLPIPNSAQIPKILYLLKPDEAGYDAQIQHGYLLLQKHGNPYGWVNSWSVNYNGYLFSVPTYSELYDIYKTEFQYESSNPFYYVSATLTTAGFHLGKNLVIDFNKRIRNIQDSKGLLLITRDLNAGVYIIYRF